MEQEKKHKDEELRSWHSPDKNKHFSTPEAYFDSLTDRIMAGLDALPQTDEPNLKTNISWWTKAKPSLYLAASFVGLFLGFKGILLLQEQQNASSATATPLEDAYSGYYEDYANRLVANEVEHELDETLYL